MLAVAARVLAAEVEGHEDAEDQGHGLGGDEGAVARVVHGLVLGDVEEAGDDAAQVAETDVHGCQVTWISFKAHPFCL